MPVAQALLFGGGTVMLGSALAGTAETPGEIVHKPVVLLNQDGFYDPLLQFFARMIEENFMRASSLQQFAAAGASVVRRQRDDRERGEVEETLKGAPAKELAMDLDGGSLDGLTLRVSDLQSLEPGDRAVFDALIGACRP